MQAKYQPAHQSRLFEPEPSQCNQGYDYENLHTTFYLCAVFADLLRRVLGRVFD
jgi:hypothetical protein